MQYRGKILALAWAGGAALALALAIAGCTQDDAAPATSTAAAPTTVAAAPFTKAHFAALQANNALILIDVAASWCPTCKRQKAAIAQFQQQHPEVALQVLTVDFDQQKEWVTYFKAPRQSTFIVFRGAQQRWFAVAETREEVIFAELLRAAGTAGDQ